MNTTTKMATVILAGAVSTRLSYEALGIVALRFGYHNAMGAILALRGAGYPVIKHRVVWEGDIETYEIKAKA